jgi:poly(3-hydroxybutyrate) depolymerase
MLQDRTDDKATPAPATKAPDSLSGANHPLAAPPPEATSKTPPPETPVTPQAHKVAVELIPGANGQQVEKPLSQLNAGDHTIELPNGRQFLVHVPATDGSGAGTVDGKLPAMFVFSGSAEPQYKITDFAPESGMNGVADQDPKHPFVVVYDLLKEHKLGVYSAQPAWGYNTTGVLIDEPDRKNAGYDDVDNLKSIVDLLPKITNVNPSHDDWGAVAFSQGGLFLNKVVSTIPNLFPSIDLVGTSMQEGYKYDVQPGNAKNVSIVELLADKTTLPMRGLFSQSWTYDKQLLERLDLHDLNIGNFHGKAVIERTDPLAAIHNEKQKPQLENKTYIGRLGNSGSYTVQTSELPTPVASKTKDSESDYTPKDPNDHREVKVVRLVEAQHSYPAPLYGPRTNATPKYTEYDASRQFANSFNLYNDRVHAEQLVNH